MVISGGILADIFENNKSSKKESVDIFSNENSPNTLDWIDTIEKINRLFKSCGYVLILYKCNWDYTRRLDRNTYD